MFARYTILGFAIVGALVAFLVQGCKETREGTEGGETAAILRTYETVPGVSARAAFVDVGSDQIEVRVFARGTDTKPPGSTGSLQSIGLYGARGRHGSDVLGAGTTHKLVDVPGPTKPNREWEILRGTFPKFAKNPAPEKFREDFSVLLRFTYKNGSDYDTINRVGMFSSLAPPAVELDLQVPVAAAGDQISLLTGKGTFFGSDGIAMYDFTVKFDGSATVIEAYAARKDAPGFPTSFHKIYSQTFSGLSGQHDVKGLIGRYNSSYDEYWLEVSVTADGHTDTERGKFTDIIDNQGVLVPLEW